MQVGAGELAAVLTGSPRDASDRDLDVHGVPALAAARAHGVRAAMDEDVDAELFGGDVSPPALPGWVEVQAATQLLQRDPVLLALPAYPVVLHVGQLQPAEQAVALLRGLGALGRQRRAGIRGPAGGVGAGLVADRGFVVPGEVGGLLVGVLGDGEEDFGAQVPGAREGRRVGGDWR